MGDLFCFACYLAVFLNMPIYSAVALIVFDCSGKRRIIADKVNLFVFSGEDISICVCLAILMSLFDDRGMRGYLITTLCPNFDCLN